MNDRKHLVSAEVDKLINATRDSRNEAHDRRLLLLMFRHGLRSGDMVSWPGSPARSPHMLRHAYGFARADQGADTRLLQDYLGHRNTQHTVIYTAANPARFERLWR